MTSRKEARFPSGATAAVAAGIVILPVLSPSLTLASEILVLGTGALGCMLLLGSVGLLSFGQGLYFGVGAYLTGFALREGGWSAVSAVAAAIAASAACAAMTGFLAVRRQGVYFVMLTLAFAQMGFFAALSLGGVTGGENGFGNVPRPVVVLGLGSLASPLATYAFLACLAFLAFVLVQRLIASPFGTVLGAIRANDARAGALGYDTRLFKLAAFVIAGALSGLAGAMNTLFLSFVPLTAIELEMSERLLIAALIGGVGAPIGAFIGAAVLSLMSDLLSPLWPRWLLIVGLFLIVIVLYLRGGLLGLVEATRRLRRGADKHD